MTTEPDPVVVDDHADGRRHMEYVNQRGSYHDLPLEKIFADFAKFYPAATGDSSDDPAFAADS